MRWYIIEPPEAAQEDCDCQWKITSWSRSKIIASHKAVRSGGHSVYAQNRRRAAAIARNLLWGIEVDWKKFEVRK